MGDWLRVYNDADVVPFIEAFKKMAGEYYPDKIDICIDAVGIPGISMIYVLNKSLEKNKKLELYSPGGICYTYAEINEKGSSIVVVIVPWGVVFIVKNVSQICRPWKSVGVKKQTFMCC